MVLHKTPKNSRNLKNRDIFLQSSMGCLGQVTKPFGHFFSSGNGQIRNLQASSFKMIPRNLSHPWGAANLKNKALGF